MDSKRKHLSIRSYYFYRSDHDRPGRATSRVCETRRRAPITPSLAPRLLHAYEPCYPLGRGTANWVRGLPREPGPFNTPVNVEALTPEMVRNAQSSGITAVNLTIGGGNPEGVFQSMARWERDLDRHPNVL